MIALYIHIFKDRQRIGVLTQTTSSDKGDSMIRGYGSGQVLREKIIERMRYLQDEITTLQKSIDKLKEQTAASEERIQRLKKELRFL